MGVCSSCNTHLHSPKLILSCFFMISILFFLSTKSSATPLSFNFTSFNLTGNDIELRKDANISKAESTIELTKPDGDMLRSTGRAMYKNPMQLWDKVSSNLADFTTHFSFVIDALGNSIHGDGMAFFLAPINFPIPEVYNGSGLGLVREDQLLNPPDPFVAVEFDTYINLELDPEYEHVGININSMKSNNTLKWSSGVMEAKTNEAWISYNSSSLCLTVKFTCFQGNDTIIKTLYHVVDLRDYFPEWVTIGFSAATGVKVETHTIHSWEFNSYILSDDKGQSTVRSIPPPYVSSSPPPPSASRTSSPPPPVSERPSPPPRGGSKGTLLIGLTGAGFACILVLGGLGFIFFSFSKKRNISDGNEDPVLNLSLEFQTSTGPKKFSYDTLACATNNFGEEQKLGEGGFGGVYKGFITEFNSYIAVKKISRGSKQGIKEYTSEVKIFSRIRHKNLVQLLGWCHEKRELLLVYEYMPNGSLDCHLFEGECLLTWLMRYNIAQGLASALLYLHEEWEEIVLHRDIKSSNIMLDSRFNAKLGDFGLARLVDHGKGSRTTLLAGTIGYMAPECFNRGKAGKESDVYSFGIVALEIACGRKAIDPKAEENQIRIMEWVWELFGKGKMLEAADKRLRGEFDDKQMECLMIVGLWCTHPDYSQRPSMRQANLMLNFEAPLPILPPMMPEPTGFAPPMNQSASSSLFTSDSTVSETPQTPSVVYNHYTEPSRLTTSSVLPPSMPLVYTI